MVAFVGGFPPDLDNSAQTAVMLNEAKQDPKNLFKSYQATYWSEVRGSLDAYMDVLGEIGLYLFERAGGDPSRVPREQVHESASRLRELFYHGAKKFGLKAPVPSIHVGVTLYSRMQWDRKRPYKGNDVFDFAHAGAALPYCDAFATEKPLAALLDSSGLSSEYQCRILTDTSAVAEWARG
jgi:hypothetical protein